MRGGGEYSPDDARVSARRLDLPGTAQVNSTTCVQVNPAPPPKIEASEQFYHDDPNHGPRDVATRLRNVNYLFLGNRLIQAAQQHASEGDGTLAGLRVKNPDRLRQKRAALTMDAETGLAGGAASLPVA